jgi:ribosome-binding factor A
MSGNHSRAQRIEQQMLRTLAQLVMREVKDPRVGSVTITAVTLAADGGSARVYFLPFGDKHTPAEVGAGLNSAAGFLRGEVGRQLGLRHAPKLEFEHDVNIERAHQLTSLIETARRQDRERGGE